MPGTYIKIIPVDEESPYLQEVIDLGTSNSLTLGFLPKGAFIKYAADHQILVALGDSEKVLGYMIYGISQRKNLAYIVHLCVWQSHRFQGVAKELFKKLKELTKDQFRGIRVHCRRDYEASAIWPKLGFIAIGEMPGRSKHRTTITIWWFDHGHPTLFTYADEHRMQSKLKVAIDANVLFQLLEPLDFVNEESQALMADWLQENVELCLTKEVFNEINRHPDSEIRRRERTFASGFIELTSTSEEFNNVCNTLQALLSEPMRVSDESDLRQLAWSIASGVQFFVTRDSNLLEKDEVIHAAFGLHVIRPTDLIINQDLLMREIEYYPARLAGSQISTERVRSDMRAFFKSVFSASQGETKRSFQMRLNAYLSDPHTNKTSIVQSAGQPLALSICRLTQKELEIPVFRLAPSILSATLARHLALQFVLTSSREKRVLTRVTDPFLTDIVVDALQEVGFIPVNGIWTKANITAVEKTERLASRLVSLIVDFPSSRQYFEQMIDTLIAAHSIKDNLTILKIERSLWPAKVTDVDIPAFIVPIQPVWAMNLFDTGIANQDLFGGEPRLILNVENVYYRSQRPKVLCAPARVLWYVSKGKVKYEGTMSIRACSYIDEVAIDRPKILYSRFRRLGVYQWKDVFEIAKKNVNNKIMAFRFSNTELFDFPIYRDELQEIWQGETSKGFHLRSPISIPVQRFFNLYKKGIGLAWE